jgi:hypothetical protein
VKRGVFDLLRRGLDNAFANWQVSLIRFLEAIAFLFLTVGTILIVLAPIFVSLGLKLADLQQPDDVAQTMAALLQKWVLLVWVFVALSVMVLVFMLIHSFVEAGCARVIVDADRSAGPAATGARARYRTFSLDRFMTGAKNGWWPVFWIYNIVWGLACLLLLIPLLPTIALMLIFRAQEGVAVIAGCLGLLVTGLFAILVTIIAAIWCNRAIVNWAARGEGARAAVSHASAEIRLDLGRHLGVAVAIFVVAMAGSAFFATFSMFAGFGEAFGRGENVLMLMMLPLRFVGSILNSAFSAFLGTWFLGCYSAIALDPRR